MQKRFSSIPKIGMYYVFLLVLLLVRIYQLPQSAPFDYDSVYNYQILKQIATKNYENLFHHASPFFYAVFSIFYAVSSDFWFLLYLNAFIGTLAIHIFVATFSKHNIFLLLFLGLSLLLVASSRYLSIEGISLLGSALLWNKIKYFFDASKNFFVKNENLTSHFSVHYFSFSLASLLLFLLLSNYKIVVPIFFLFLGATFLSHKQAHLQSKYVKIVFFSTLYLLAGLLLLMLLGAVLGQRWYQYPATLFAIVATAQNTTASTWDWSYYFRYIFSFENSFLLIFLGIALIHFIKNYSQTEDFEKIVWWVFLGTFFVMTLLAKAPRGLIFCLPLGYILVFRWGYQYLQKAKKSAILLACFFLAIMLYQQSSKIVRQIYDYSFSNYPKVAQYLSKHRAEVVFSTLGLSIYPYLDKDIKLVVLREAKDTVAFSQYSGKKFLLYDAYAEVSNHRSLLSLKNTNFDTTFVEPTLASEMLSLESSQYTGFTFSESIKISKQIQEASFQIGIRRIKE